MKKIMMLMMAVLMFGAMVGLNVEAQEKWPNGQQKWPEKVRIGLIPTEGNADTLKRFIPLMKHLEKELGIKVEAVSANDYAGVINAMAGKHIEFAYFGPKSYTEAAEKAGAEAVVLEKNKAGEPGYYGVIITHKDSGIKTLQDAKGKTFAFTDPNSTSGFLVPNVLFARDLKVRPESYFSKVSFSGSHGTSILMVYNKKIQVAATNNIDLDRMHAKGAINKNDFVTLWKSELIPGSPFVVRNDLPSSLKAAFAGAMLKFNENKEGIETLQNGGFMYVNDSTYNVIRYLKRLKSQLQSKQ